MSEVKITDLVSQEVIDKIKELNSEMQDLLSTYINVAKELAKGLEIPIKGLDGIDKLMSLLATSTKTAVTTTEQLNDVIDRQRALIGQTTNVRSRELMEIERRNKLAREEYTSGVKVSEVVTKLTGNYEQHVKQYNELNLAIEANKKKRDELTKSFKNGMMSEEQYLKALHPLVVEERNLKQAKSDLQSMMKVEEKLANSNAESYKHLSQQLELLKKTYKDLDDAQRESEEGREMEAMIQDLDAHLKDMAADMGEFQRNVGNYAIAGQNGVVATESLNEVLARHAVTLQDVMDQTKILNEAKIMLDQNDEHYQETLDAINRQLDENKKKLLDVSDIVGKEAKSVAEAEEQNKRLKEAIRNMDSSTEEARETIRKYNDQIEANNELIEDNCKWIGRHSEYCRESADSLFEFVGINDSVLSSFESLETGGDVIAGIGVKVKALSKTLMGLLANPVMLTFLGIAGVAAGFKWWYEFNKGLEEATRRTKDFTGLTGKELKAVRNELSGLSTAFGKEFDETAEATNALAKQYGISFQEALKLIEDGFIAGADANGEFLENVKEYPAYFREAGISASEFIAITTKANQAGIYSDKGIDVIKEGNLRIREMTKSTAEALDAIGISSKEAMQQLADGSKTTFDIMKEVSAKLAEFPESSTEVGTALADIFGGPGEDAGLQYILTLKDIDDNLENVKAGAGELGEIQEEQLRSQIALQNALATLFDSTGGSFERMKANVMIFARNALTSVIKKVIELTNWFVDLYNTSLSVRQGVASIGTAFVALWEMGKVVIKWFLDGWRMVAEAGAAAFDLDWDGVKNAVSKRWDAMEENGKKAWDRISRHAKESMEEAEVSRLTRFEEVSMTDRTSETDEKAAKSDYKIKQTDEEKKAADNAAKEAAKTAKEELKRILELEEAKLAVMQEGHEKELAQIRLNFRKKIETIEGEGATQTALRLQLAEQCEKEVGACEMKYQKELSKINLDNRLAAVRKGSKEELDLRLAQIEAERDAELEASNRTGADKDLINEKFNRRRVELQEDYASNYVSTVQERFAVEQILRDKAYIEEANDIKERYARELEAASGNETKMEEVRKRHDDAMYALDEKYSRESATKAVEMYENLIDTEGLSVEDREKLRMELMKAKMDMSAMEADYEIQNAERVTQKEQEELEKRKAAISQWLNIAADGLNSINDLAQTIFDAKIERIEEEQEANTEAGEEEQQRITELVEKQVITEEEGEARKRAAEAATAKKNEELERKKAKLKQKQAVFDKANSLAQAGIATALAITQALPNLVLAAIAGAMGAIQIATILATPIPKYANGTDDHKGGPAIVGDGGRPEVVIIGNSMWVTPDRPTLVDMPKGASVIPDINEMITFNSPDLTVPVKSESQVVVSGYNDRNVIRSVEELGRLIRQQTKMQKRIADQKEYELFKSRI